MDKKMDLLDMQRKFQEQYGIIDEEMGKVSKAHILTFWKDDEGRILSKLPRGGIVFRHREGGMQISEGETWVCEVLERNTTHFAIGMLRFDAKSFYDLRNDQVDHIADLIWEKNQSMLEPRFEGRYLEMLERKVEERAEEAKKRAEEEMGRAEGLRKQIEALELKHKMETNALEKELQEIKAQTNQPSADPDVSQASGLTPSTMLHPKVRRLGPDQVQSDEFRDRRYFVHVSVDRNIMTIRPHEEGNVSCVDGRLTMTGLGLLSSYSGPTDLSAEYSPKYGGYLVVLKG